MNCTTPRSVLSALRLLAVVALAVVSVLAGAVPAAADSIVFAKDGNVWLANPDGSGQYQVTLDGTAADPYESPSQADDGTIVAARGSGRNRLIYRMRQNGALLNQPINTVAPAEDPRIAPNGSLVAYWFITATSYFDCSYCLGTYSQTVLTYPDRLTRYEEVAEPYCCQEPSWIGNSALLMTNGSAKAWYHVIGTPGAKEWFTDDEIQSFRDGEVSPGGDRLAMVRGPYRATLQLYAMNGPLPAKPTAGCLFQGAAGGEFHGPTWSPDGGSVAWQDADGIWAAAIPSTSDCEAINAAGGGRLVIPGGDNPDWGPANVNPGPRPRQEPGPDDGNGGTPDNGSTPDNGNGQTPVAPRRAGKCSTLKGKKRAACIRKSCGRLKRKRARYRTCVKNVTRVGTRRAAVARSDGH